MKRNFLFFLMMVCILYAPCVFSVTKKSEKKTILQRIVVSEKTKIVIVGDLHGHWQTLYGFLKDWFNAKFITAELDIIDPNVVFVFLGDYVDRGKNSIIILHYLVDFLRLNEGKVFLLRGNHEVGPEVHTKDFWGDGDKRRGSLYEYVCYKIAGCLCDSGGKKEEINEEKEILKKLLLQFYDYLPHGLFIDFEAKKSERIFLCHGAPTFPEKENKNRIKKEHLAIERLLKVKAAQKITIPFDEENNYLWNDALVKKDRGGPVWPDGKLFKWLSKFGVTKFFKGHGHDFCERKKNGISATQMPIANLYRDAGITMHSRGCSTYAILSNNKMIYRDVPVFGETLYKDEWLPIDIFKDSLKEVATMLALGKVLK